MPVLHKEYTSRTTRIGTASAAPVGRIAAFTVAWERPNQFHKVLSFVGSFVNLRGGNVGNSPIIVPARAGRSRSAFSCRDGRNDNRGARTRRSYDESRDWFLPKRKG